MIGAFVLAVRTIEKMKWFLRTATLPSWRGARARLHQGDKTTRTTTVLVDSSLGIGRLVPSATAPGARLDHATFTFGVRP
jgi:hypothetical protein